MDAEEDGRGQAQVDQSAKMPIAASAPRKDGQGGQQGAAKQEPVGGQDYRVSSPNLYENDRSRAGKNPDQEKNVAHVQLVRRVIVEKGYRKRINLQLGMFGGV